MPQPQGKKWTKEEEESLKVMIEDGLTKTEICNALGRNKNSVAQKVCRLGLQIYNVSDSNGTRGRIWTKQDDELLTELWEDGVCSNNQISKMLRRPWGGIKKRAVFLGLKDRAFDTSFLSMQDIADEMQISKSQIASWINLGLKTKKKRIGRYVWRISQDNLLNFLETHQNLFDASLISEYLFFDEPEWLIKKREEDKNKPKNIRRYYTNDEDKEIQRLFYSGVDDVAIARALNRTESGIQHRRWVLGLLKDETGV